MVRLRRQSIRGQFSRHSDAGGNRPAIPQIRPGRWYRCRRNHTRIVGAGITGAAVPSAARVLRVFVGMPRMDAVTEISLILFDLNGVLYRYDREVRIAFLSLVSGVPAGDIRRTIWDSGFEDSGDAGVLDAPAYLLGFGACIGYHLSEAEWVAAQQAAVTPIAATITLLSAVRTGVACAVLTNNNLLVRRHFPTLYPEVAALVGSRAFVSAEFGARKPDPEAYRRCLVRLGQKPAAALFVDDGPGNVAGAREAGLHAHHYTNSEDLALELRAYGLLDWVP
jgi:HAD superfamily hydrolase (TIGR01509 family)